MLTSNSRFFYPYLMQKFRCAHFCTPDLSNFSGCTAMCAKNVTDCAKTVTGFAEQKGAVFMNINDYSILILWHDCCLYKQVMLPAVSADRTAVCHKRIFL